MAELRRFLSAPGRGRHAYGINDCLLFPADWVLLRTGLDPAEPFRGAYSTEAEAEAILSAHGGIVALVSDRMAALGLKPADAHRGAVGIVPAGEKLTGAIFDGRRWVTPSSRGLFGRQAVAHAIWGMHG